MNLHTKMDLTKHMRKRPTNLAKYDELVGI